jgi:hypothetical protein
MYGDFPAKNTVYTYKCMVLANPSHGIELGQNGWDYDRQAKKSDAVSMNIYQAQI